MICVGSVSRDEAAVVYPFLGAGYRGRRRAIKEFTHRDPEFVFWIYPDGRLHDAGMSHAKGVPRGFEWIVEDEPDYGGFLRGRVVRQEERRLVVVYCREEALAVPGEKVRQFLRGVEELPLPLDGDALVISDNGDIYGTMDDLQARSGALS